MVNEMEEERPLVPRGALIGAAVLLSVTLVSVASMRLIGIEPAARIHEPEVRAVSRTVHFEEQSNGEVFVYAHDNGSQYVIDVLTPGTAGFLQGMLRGLKRVRANHGISLSEPYLLTQQPDGGLLLEDPSTDEILFLQAFGVENAESVAQLLTAGPMENP